MRLKFGNILVICAPCRVVLLLLDKAEMIRGFLISIMAGLIVKDNLQGNVEIPVVHLPRQLRIQTARRKKDNPWVISKIFLIGSNQAIDRLCRIIVQGKIDVMCKHVVLQSYFSVFWKTET